jgi:hypothetical protein
MRHHSYVAGVWRSSVVYTPTPLHGSRDEKQRRFPFLELLDSDPDPNKGMPIHSTVAMYKYLMCLGYLKVELNTEDSLADEQEETTSEYVDGDFLVNIESSEGIAKKFKKTV